MKTFFLALILVFLFMNSVSAQNTDGIAAFLKVGNAEAPGSARTLRAIAPKGIAGFTNTFSLIGIEGQYLIGKAIFILDGNAGVQRSYRSGIDYVEPFIASGQIKFGWIVSQNKRYWIYPSIGSGGSGLMLSTYQKTGGDLENMKNVNLFSYSYDLGINGNFFVSKKLYENEQKGWLLGFRAGYWLAFSHNRWHDENGDRLQNLPSYTNNAFYLTIAVGRGVRWRY